MSDIERVVNLEDRKYTVVYNERRGTLIAERNSEYWRDLTGDKLVGAMFHEIERLSGVIDEVHSWAVCAVIASAEDMAQNFPRIVKITEPPPIEGLPAGNTDTARLNWLLPIVSGEGGHVADTRTYALGAALAEGEVHRDAIDHAMKVAP